MITKLKQHVQAGFTLVELLIVVIILSILAAIVIPQFSSSTTDAQEAALDSNLAALRSAIELFKAQHANLYPDPTWPGPMLGASRILSRSWERSLRSSPFARAPSMI